METQSRPPSHVSASSTTSGDLKMVTINCSKSHENKDTMTVDWGGQDHRQLSKEGYQTLSICATFLAAVQSQVIALSAGENTMQSDIITGLFFLGLFASVFGAIVSFASSRWFEMLTDQENAFWHECRCDTPQRTLEAQSSKLGFVDRWVYLSLVFGPYLVVIGLIAFILGLMVYIYETQSLALSLLLTLFCVFCLCFIAPFPLRHNRSAVLAHLRLQRRSDL